MSNRRDRAAAAAAKDVPEPKALEAGVAPDEQVTSIIPAVPAPEPPSLEAPEPPEDAPSAEPTPIRAPAAAKPMSVALTGAQMAEVATRNKAVDDARARANRSRDEAVLDERTAGYAQEALTAFIGRLINDADLDEGFIYRVDVERGEIVPARVRPQAPAPAPGG